MHTLITSFPTLAPVLILTMGLTLALTPVQAQEAAEVYLTGLAAPLGLEMDARGQLWVAEQGTGNDDGMISVVTADGQKHPFMTGLRSLIFEGQPASAYHMAFHDGALWATLGLSTDQPEGYVIRVDTTGFRPGDPPLTADAAELIDIGSFVLGQGQAETNVYDLTFDAEGNLYIVDAAANAVIKRDAATEALSLLAVFGPLSNPTPVGPPVVEQVPTSIVFANDRLYVGILSGFPFVEGLAKVYEIGLDGSVSVFQEGLTLINDLTLHPSGNLAVLQFAQFGFDPPPPGFRSNTGAVWLLEAGAVKPLVTGLNFPAGMRFDAEGNLHVTALEDGTVQMIPAALVTATEDQEAVPDAFALHQNYPNPFNPATTITYALSAPTHLELTLYNALGQVVKTLVDQEQNAGTHSVSWDGRDQSGKAVGSGMYLYQLRVGDQVQLKTMVLIK